MEFLVILIVGVYLGVKLDGVSNAIEDLANKKLK